MDMSDFRQRKKDKLSSNRIWKDIRKCQHACEQLDKDKACDKIHILFTSNICKIHKQGCEPEAYWYWASTDGDGDDDIDEDYEVSRKNFHHFKVIVVCY